MDTYEDQVHAGCGRLVDASKPTAAIIQEKRGRDGGRRQTNGPATDSADGSTPSSPGAAVIEPRGIKAQNTRLLLIIAPGFEQNFGRTAKGLLLTDSL